MAGFFQEFSKGYREVIPKKTKKKGKKKPAAQAFGAFAAKSVVSSKAKLKESGKKLGADISKKAKVAGSNFLANAQAAAERQREEQMARQAQRPQSSAPEKKKQPFTTSSLNDEVQKMREDMFKF